MLDLINPGNWNILYISKIIFKEENGNDVIDEDQRLVVVEELTFYFCTPTFIVGFEIPNFDTIIFNNDVVGSVYVLFCKQLFSVGRAKDLWERLRIRGHFQNLN